MLELMDRKRTDAFNEYTFYSVHLSKFTYEDKLKLFLFLHRK